MKTNFKKLIAATGFVAAATTILVGCASTTLEQQIAVKEAGSWDFVLKHPDRGIEYLRIYDSFNKVGWFKYEYGQKHPCNQGFTLAIKSNANNLVQYEATPDSKSFACDEKIKFIFRVNNQGQPYEGWRIAIKDRDSKSYSSDMVAIVKYWDANGIVPKYKLVE